ncbi:MAG: hypothetical protein LBB60_12435 [Desulfovibrio sp.]|nr:hypothetical protein [Desulfovibrio sp.]
MPKIRVLPKPPALIVFDFDGVMTDNAVYVDQDGREMVRCHRGDGLGIDMLKKAGIPMCILSTETNPVVAARGDTPHTASYANTRTYMEKKGIRPASDLIAAHVPYPQSRSNSIAAYAFYEEAVREFGQKRFREHTGMVFTCHAAPLWAYTAERAVPCDMPFYYMNCRHYDRKVYYDAMLREKDKGTLQPFFCINDAGAAKTQNWQEDMLGFLEAYCLKPSAFELKGRHGARET